MKIHIVQKGDTLWKIAKKYGVNFEELKKMNSQLSNPDMIMPGMKVKIPTTGGNIKKEAPMGTKPGAVNLGAKKEMPLHEHPFAKEKPIAMPIKEAPIKEVPIKEAPIVKEVPKAPYTPKMPLQIIPEIDINNYYTMNMQNMTTIEQPPLPPKPANILPEVKEVPKKEVPVVKAPVQAPPPPPAPAPAPVQVEQPEYCVPVTPVMPGSGFCPPFGPVIPCPPIQGMPYPVDPGYMPVDPGYMTAEPGYVPPAPGMGPTFAGTSFVPPHYADESSSFMPQMPMMNPGYHPGGSMGAPNPYMQQPMQTYGEPATHYPPGGYGPMMTGYPGEYPGGYPASAPTGFPGEVPGGYPAGVPTGYPGEVPGGYPAGVPTGYPGGVPGGYPAGAPTGYPGGVPGGYPAGAPTGYPGGVPGGYPAGVPTGYPGGVPGGYPAGVPSGYPREFHGSYPAAPVSGAGYVNPSVAPPYGQYPYGYPQMGMGAAEFDYPEFSAGSYMPPIQETAPAQNLPVGTGALGDCGCGAAPVQPPMAGQQPEQGFVPPTPPIYSAPFTAQVSTVQPPLMNPYGMGSIGAHPYGMPRYLDESNENGN